MALLRASLLLVTLVAAVFAARRPGAPNKQNGLDVIVNAPAGSLKGSRVGGTDYFLGVPFAAPPLGELRWREPQPATKWSGVRDAQFYAPNCLSTHSDYVFDMNEDCLYLNVYRPSDMKPGEKLPVMVWIFGGSFKYGGSSFLLYDGHPLSSLGRVVFVSMNYRLGTLGYLGARALKAESPTGSTGNYGLQDQRVALQWVQTNIAAFGGDADNVLLFGQSAGGSSTSAHIASHHSKGLFHRAIVESGPPSDWGQFTLDDADGVAQFVGQRLNCTQADAKAWVACMRSINGTEITQQDGAPAPHNAIATWAPVIDGVEWTENIQSIWARGDINPIDAVIFGTVQDEGTEFMDLPFDATEQQYEAYLNATFPAPIFANVTELYPSSDFATPFVAAERGLTHAAMACPSQRAGRWSLAKTKTKVYVYYWAHLVELLKLAEPHWLVGHCSEVPFVFHDRYTLLGKGEPELADQVVAYWTNFAATGNPNTLIEDSRVREVVGCQPAVGGGSLVTTLIYTETGYSPTLAGPNNPSAIPVKVTWPEFNSTTTSHLVLNVTSYAADGYVPAKYCNFWDAVYEMGCDIDARPMICPSLA